MYEVEQLVKSDLFGNTWRVVGRFDTYTDAYCRLYELRDSGETVRIKEGE